MDFKGGQIHFSRRADRQGNFSRRVKDFSCSQCSTMLNWEGLRHLFPRGGGGNQENSFPQGVNIIPDGAKQLSYGVLRQIFLHFQRVQNIEVLNRGGGKDIKCNSPIKGMLCK